MTTDNAIKEDLIIGRDAILDILKLSHWRYVEYHYLDKPGCPIALIGGRWMTRRSLLDAWLSQILLQKSGTGAVQNG